MGITAHMLHQRLEMQQTRPQRASVIASSYFAIHRLSRLPERAYAAPGPLHLVQRESRSIGFDNRLGFLVFLREIYSVSSYAPIISVLFILIEAQPTVPLEETGCETAPQPWNASAGVFDFAILAAAGRWEGPVDYGRGHVIGVLVRI